MKINNVLKQTALAAAIAAVSFSATAGTITIDAPAVIANEVFGNESENTSVRLPKVEFTATGDVKGKTASGATVKLTLLGQPIFSENYQDPAAWKSQGIKLSVDGAVIDTDVPGTITEITGGTANDNQITIEFGAGVTGNLDTISIEGFKVKRLKDALERRAGTPVRQSKVTLEVRSAAGEFENTPYTSELKEQGVAFVSINGLAVTPSATSYENNTRAKIQSGALQKQFTAATKPDDFDLDNVEKFIALGGLEIVRNKVPTGFAGAGLEAGKETGVKFDFTGSDTVSLTLNADAPLAGYGKVYLSSAACTAPVANVKFDQFTVVDPAVMTSTIAIPTADINLDGGTTWQLCAVVDGEKRIPQAAFSTVLNAKYVSARYTDSQVASDYGKVLRNGCQVTLFNLPNVNAADNAFIRFTNTSDVAGEVNAYVWNEAGEQLDVGATIATNIEGHATTVFHTSKDQQTGVYLGNVLPEFAASTGRSRIVLEGAFKSCEALGLVRSDNGTLVNMTSTVYSGSENNTSNTSN